MSFLARLLDAFLNRISPMPDLRGAEWLAEAEASQEVWEPQLLPWEQELIDAFYMTDEQWAAAYPKTPTGSAAAPSPRLGSGPGGPTQEKERPRAAATAGATQERRNLMSETITGPPLSGTGYVAFDCTKLSTVQAKAADYMGRVDCTLGGVRISLTESDWAHLFDAVNRATNNRLHSKIVAAVNARTFR